MLAFNWPPKTTSHIIVANRNALEELSIRADIAFNQKKLVNMLCSADDESTEIDMRTISAQLVRLIEK